MTEKKSFVQVYTGNGKGKTTAAIGLAVRALGAGKKVAMIQFMKAMGYSEHNILKTLSPDLTHLTVGKPFFIAREGSVSEEELKKYSAECVVFPLGKPPEEYVKLIDTGLEKAKEYAVSGRYDLLILDEINCALFFGLTQWARVDEIIKSRADNTELVLTGRGAPDELIEAADLVTEMKEIKHYYQQGVMARRGIEN